MKVTEQTKQVKHGVENGTHSFFTKLAEALQKKIKQDTGIDVAFLGKVTTGPGTMKAVLTGEFNDPDPKKVEEAGKKIEQTMNHLKNPAALVDLIK